MKLKVLQENLSGIVALVSRFTSSRSQLAVLESIVFEVQGKELYLIATDMDKAIRARVAAKVEGEGRVAVPGRILAELVKSLPLGAVELEMVGKELVIRAGKMKSVLQTVDLSDYPELQFGQDKDYWGEIEVSQVVEIWKEVGMAVSKDVTRPVLTALLWELSSGRVVATDGYRLSVVKGMPKLGEKPKEVEQALVPGEVWQELVQAADKTSEKHVRVGMIARTGQLAFSWGEVEMIGKEVEGEYPNYKAIVPKQFTSLVVVSRDEFLEAVRAAAIFAKDSSNIVKLDFSESAFVVSANAPQVGQSEVGVGTIDAEGGDFTIAFNSKYLVDFLTSIDEGQVKLEVNESLQPAKLSLEGNEHFYHVVMPVRVRE